LLKSYEIPAISYYISSKITNIEKGIIMSKKSKTQAEIFLACLSELNGSTASVMQNGISTCVSSFTSGINSAFEHCNLGKNPDTFACENCIKSLKREAKS
jgi:hypothetical protein